MQAAPRHRSPDRRPLPHHPMNGIQAVAERRRTRLQDERRFDLVQLAVANRGNGLPPGPSRHSLRAKPLAAPGTEHDIRSAAHDLAGVAQDAVLAERTRGALGKDIVAAGDADQFTDPADAADERLVPFLEVHPRTPRQTRSGLPHTLDMRLE